MSFDFVSKLTIGQTSPLMLNAIGDVAIAIRAAFQGAIDLGLTFELTPPNLEILLQVLAEFDANISAAIGLSLPNVSFGLDAALSAIAKLELAFDLLIALDLLLAINAPIFTIGTQVLVGQQAGASFASFIPSWPDGYPGTANMVFFVCPTFPIPLPPPLDPNQAAKQVKKFFNGMTWPDDGDFGTTSRGDPLGVCLKCVGDAAIEGNAGIQYQLDLALQLKASLAVTPPSLNASLSAMAKFQAFLLANADLVLPKVKFAINASASITAELGAKFSGMFDLGAALAFPSPIFIYKYHGTAAALFGPGPASDIYSEVGPTATPTPNTWGDHGVNAFSSLGPATIAVAGCSDLNILATPIIPAFFAGAFV